MSVQRVCNIQLCVRLLGILLLCTGVSHTFGAILGIDSVVLDGANALVSARIGGTDYAGGRIADYAEDGRPGTPIAGHPFAAGSPAPTGTAISPTDQLQAKAFDNNVLTGAAGDDVDTQTGGVMILRWGTSFTDNDTDPDFFVFEDLGNDLVDVQAILSDGTLGAAIRLTGWNTVATNGVLSVNPDDIRSNRTVSGVSFGFTDLLDATGQPLALGTSIQGIVIGDAPGADFFEIYAAVEATTIPEPASMVMIIAGLAVCFVRKPSLLFSVLQEV